MHLKELWQKDENQSMKGWDFSYLDGRWSEEGLPFDYKESIHRYLKSKDSILDMGTGGGEFLLSLNHRYNLTFATEGYKPNYDYCLEHLSPLGITVKAIEKRGEIPFSDNKFDLVINKHSYYDIKEVYRVLKPGGIFVTQQIGSYNNQELSRVFIEGFELPNRDNHLDTKKNEFLDFGFELLEAEEYFPVIQFKDIGALVFFCKTIVWEFPDFSVEKYYKQLLTLHDQCRINKSIKSKEHRYMIVAKK